jgi:hypothetical protein
VVEYENPHHWEILRATRLTLGAIPLMPVPLRAAAMRPPIQDPWPFQSVFSGPPNWAARTVMTARAAVPRSMRRGLMPHVAFSVRKVMKSGW